MGIMVFLVVLLLAANLWLYMEIRALRRRADDMDEDLCITWSWCDTHAKEHVKLEDRIKRIEEGLDIDEEALTKAEREEKRFFDGMNNILNYTYDDARKAAAADE